MPGTKGHAARCLDLQSEFLSLFYRIFWSGWLPGPISALKLLQTRCSWPPNTPWCHQLSNGTRGVPRLPWSRELWPVQASMPGSAPLVPGRHRLVQAWHLSKPGDLGYQTHPGVTSFPTVPVASSDSHGAGSYATCDTTCATTCARLETQPWATGPLGALLPQLQAPTHSSSHAQVPTPVPATMAASSAMHMWQTGGTKANSNTWSLGGGPAMTCASLVQPPNSKP